MPLDHLPSRPPRRDLDGVHFGMRESGTENIVGCRVSSEALKDHFGANSQDEEMYAFEVHRFTIEGRASEKFDDAGGPDIVNLDSSDF